MVDMPTAIPPGVDPVAYLNWLAQTQYQQQQQQFGQQQQQQTQNNYLNGQQLQLFLKLIDQAQSRYQDAKNANETTRNDILKGRTDTRNRILDNWNQYGDSLVNDTNQGYKTNLNNSLTALYDTGLGQSTVNSSIRARNEKERQDSMRRVKDDIIGNYAGADERLSNNIDDFQERVTNAYPDTPPINALAGQLGSITGLPSMGGAGGDGASAMSVASPGTAMPSNPYMPMGGAARPNPVIPAAASAIAPMAGRTSGIGGAPLPPRVRFSEPVMTGGGATPAPAAPAPAQNPYVPPPDRRSLQATAPRVQFGDPTVNGTGSPPPAPNMSPFAPPPMLQPALANSPYALPNFSSQAGPAPMPTGTPAGMSFNRQGNMVANPTYTPGPQALDPTEAARRSAMVGLTDAENTPGPAGERAVRHQLDQMQLAGFASPNPAKMAGGFTPPVQMADTGRGGGNPYQVQPYTGGGGPYGGNGYYHPGANPYQVQPRAPIQRGVLTNSPEKYDAFMAATGARDVTPGGNQMAATVPQQSMMQAGPFPQQAQQQAGAGGFNIAQLMPYLQMLGISM
jgi:hypothetical protein